MTDKQNLPTCSVPKVKFNQSDLNDKINQVRTRITLNQPFFARFSSGRDIEPVDPHTLKTPDGYYCETACTNGVKMYYNPHFFATMSVPQITGVILHEIYHIFLLHCTRGGDRNPMLWCVATDYCVNALIYDLIKDLQGIQQGNLFELPKPHLYEKRFENMSPEAIYNILMRENPPQKFKFSLGKGKGGSGEGDDLSEMWGGVLKPVNEDGSEMTPGDIENLETEIEIAKQEAADAAKVCGKLPASLQGLIESKGEAKIDWVNFIQQWIRGCKPEDFTFERYNRNMYNTLGVIFPTLKSTGSGVGVLSFDVSGSVSDDELQKHFTEAVGVVEMTKPDKLYIIQHDSEVKRVDVWESHDPMDKLEIVGRGGTCIQPVFKKVNRLEEKPDWFIGFSDMEIFDFPKEAPDYPVLWCSTGQLSAPFGDVINLRARYSDGS